MRRTLLFSSVLCATLAAAHAHAGNDRATQADQRYREGRAFFAKYDFENARQSFLQAYALDAQPRFLWNLSISEVKSNHPADALRHFRAYFHLPVATAKEHEQVRALIEDAASKTGHIRIECPSGVKLVLDGAPLGEEPPLADPIDVTAGGHAIEAHLGAVTKSISATAGPGQTIAVVFRFEGEPTASATPVTESAANAIGANANASGPGGSADTTPSSSGGAAPGADTSSTARVVTVASIAGVGVIAAGISVGYFVGAGDATDQRRALAADNPRCPQPPMTPGCQQLHDAADAHTRDTNAGVLLVASGAGLIVAGAALWFLWPALGGAASTGGNGTGGATGTRAKSALMPTLVPTIAPGGAGASLAGRF